MNHIVGGRLTVDTIGHPEPLSDTEMIVAHVDIMALATNTDNIALGAKDVRAIAGNESFWELEPKNIWSLDNVDLSTIYIDAVVAGEGIRWGAIVERPA